MPDTLDTVAPGLALREDADAGVVSNASSVGHFPLHTRTMRETEIRVWRLVYPTATPAERATLAGVYDDAMTGDGSTEFTPPGAGSAITVRFLSRAIDFHRQSAAWETVEFRIRELL